LRAVGVQAEVDAIEITFGHIKENNRVRSKLGLAYRCSAR